MMHKLKHCITTTVGTDSSITSSLRVVSSFAAAIVDYIFQAYIISEKRDGVGLHIDVLC